MPEKASLDFDPNAGQYVSQTTGDEKRVHHVFEPNQIHLNPTYITQVLERIQPRENGLYLDVGGGSGEIAKKLEELYGGHAVVTDNSLAGFQVSEATDNALAQAAEQPFGDHIFDLVHSKDMIVHLENVTPFLREVYRVLTPGGIAVITTQEFSDNEITLVYGSKPNERISIPVADAEEYNEILQLIKAGRAPH